MTSRENQEYKRVYKKSKKIGHEKGLALIKYFDKRVSKAHSLLYQFGTT